MSDHKDIETQIFEAVTNGIAYRCHEQKDQINEKLPAFTLYQFIDFMEIYNSKPKNLLEKISSEILKSYISIDDIFRNNIVELGEEIINHHYHLLSNSEALIDGLQEDIESEHEDKELYQKLKDLLNSKILSKK